MNRPELDNCLHQLDQVYAVYDKKISEKAARVWMETFGGNDEAVVLEALKTWVSTNDRAPRPSNIAELINRGKPKTANNESFYAGGDAFTRQALKSEKENQPEASDEVTTAFLILHRLQFNGDGGGIIPPQAFDKRVDMSRERALEICNEVCARCNMPDAIDDRFKIQSYWEG